MKEPNLVFRENKEVLLKNYVHVVMSSVSSSSTITHSYSVFVLGRQKIRIQFLLLILHHRQHRPLSSPLSPNLLLLHSARDYSQ